MILDTEALQFLQTAVNVAKLVAIDNIIIESGRVRALNTNRTVSLLQERNVPEFEFKSIGITRIPTFQSRLDIIRTQRDYVIEAVLDEEEHFVRSLLMKSRNMKIDYRCANPSSLQAPTSIRDNAKYKIPIEPDAVDLLQKGLLAMQTDTVTLISNKEGVSFELKDTNNDVFSHRFAIPSQVETESPGEDKEFTATYPAKTILAIFKEEPEEEAFYVGKQGVLRFPVHGINVFVIPKL